MMFIPMNHTKHQSMIEYREPRRINHFSNEELDQPPPLPVKKKHSKWSLLYTYFCRSLSLSFSPSHSSTFNDQTIAIALISQHETNIQFWLIIYVVINHLCWGWRLFICAFRSISFEANQKLTYIYISSCFTFGKCFWGIPL